MTNKELIEDLLTEYDELDMQPMILIPDPLDRAKRWKRELEYAINHLEAEVARKVIEEIFLRIREEFSISELGKSALNQLEAELKKKYTGEE
jgi:hypothetical protein